MDAGEDDVLDAWPTCPACGRRRLTICPFCKTSGTDFPRADERLGPVRGDDGPGVRLGLICAGCDEPWSARFLRRCEWCGHDFGEGIALESPLEVERERHEINARVAVVLFGLVATLLALLAYFVLISER